MARIVKQEEKGPMEVKVGGESSGFACVDYPKTNHFAMAHISYVMVKKKEKYTNIKMGKELKSNNFKVIKNE